MYSCTFVRGRPRNDTTTSPPFHFFFKATRRSSTNYRYSIANIQETHYRHDERPPFHSWGCARVRRRIEIVVKTKTKRSTYFHSLLFSNSKTLLRSSDPFLCEDLFAMPSKFSPQLLQSCPSHIVTQVLHAHLSPSMVICAVSDDVILHKGEARFCG